MLPSNTVKYKYVNNANALNTRRQNNDKTPIHSREYYASLDIQ